MGEMWAYRPSDTDYKSARRLIATLIEVASRGGNLLLNIAVKGDGGLVPLQLSRLGEIGEWMQTHSASVIGVRPAPEIDFYGPVTRTDTTLYLHLLLTPVEEIVVRGVEVGRVARVHLLGAEEDIPFTAHVEVHERTDDRTEPLGELRIAAPAPTGALVDVVAIEFR
jgi:alpha-L-fucosidase